MKKRMCALGLAAMLLVSGVAGAAGVQSGLEAEGVAYLEAIREAGTGAAGFVPSEETARLFGPAQREVANVAVKVTAQAGEKDDLGEQQLEALFEELMRATEEACERLNWNPEHMLQWNVKDEEGNVVELIGQSEIRAKGFAYVPSIAAESGLSAAEYLRTSIAFWEEMGRA